MEILEIPEDIKYPTLIIVDESKSKIKKYKEIWNKISILLSYRIMNQTIMMINI